MQSKQGCTSPSSIYKLRRCREDSYSKRPGRNNNASPDIYLHGFVAAQVRAFRIQKQTKFFEFKALVAKELGIPPEQQRYWTMFRRNNGTHRILRPLSEEEEQQMLMDLREHRETGACINKSALMDLKLFLQHPHGPEQALLPLQKDCSLWFFKEYLPEREALKYLTSLILPKVRRAAACGNSIQCTSIKITMYFTSLEVILPK